MPTLSDILSGGISRWVEDKRGKLEMMLAEHYGRSPQEYAQKLETNMKRNFASLTDPESKDWLGSALMATGMAPVGMTAFHGSPHRFPPTKKNPLGEFDAAKIGTGEGAQAYGHGLYLAENPGVAKGYAVRGHAQQAGTGPIKWTQGSEVKPHLYTVDLPDEHIAKMLDWDAPLSKQPESVKAGLRKIGFSVDDPRYAATTGSDFYDNIVASVADKRGSGSLKAIREFHGDQPAASKMLSEAGIPGIKYLDQGSRAAGEGSRNFVVFPGNDSILKILKRE